MIFSNPAASTVRLCVHVSSTLQNQANSGVCSYAIMGRWGSHRAVMHKVGKIVPRGVTMLEGSIV